jgi:hypothetical protein
MHLMINDNMPENENAFKIAKNRLLIVIAQRIKKEDYIWTYLSGKN